jgi:hypothetical protein
LKYGDSGTVDTRLLVDLPDYRTVILPAPSWKKEPDIVILPASLKKELTSPILEMKPEVLILLDNGFMPDPK